MIPINSSTLNCRKASRSSMPGLYPFSLRLAMGILPLARFVQLRYPASGE
jgi:hypothetical protein